MSKPDEDDAPEVSELAQRIRKLREDKGMSLRAMARLADVSVSFLSQVEHGKASPSIPTLIRLARALDEHVTALFEPRAASRVVRAGERPQLVHPHRDWTEELLSPRDFRGLQLIVSTLRPGGSSADEPYAYDPAETCALVMHGRVNFWVDGTVYELDTGDCLAFNSSVPHRVENPGRGEARILWASSPPAY